MTKKRFFALFVYVAFLVFPLFSFAQNTDQSKLITDQAKLILELQKQIDELTRQIQSVKQQVTTVQSELGVSATKPEPEPEAVSEVSLEFTRNLSRGSSGDDVRKLQEFLAKDKAIYPDGLITGYFGPKTEEALKRWQIKHKIEAVGILGPQTRARFQELGKGRIQELITEGAGASGVIPPGLLTAPGIQKKLEEATSTQATTTSQSQEDLCPKDPSKCYTEKTCKSQNYYWYTVSCHRNPPIYGTCAESYNYCINSTECSKNGFYWCRNGCYPSLDACLGQTYVAPAKPTTVSTTTTTTVATTTQTIPIQTQTTIQATTTVTTTSSTTDKIAPSIPTGITAILTNETQIRVSWTESTDNVGVTGYNIYRNGSFLTSTSTVNVSYSSRAFTDSNLSYSTIYTYTIAAYDAAGNISAQSNSVSTTTLVATTITITSPNGNEQWVQGNTHTITWTSTGNLSNVIIRLRDKSSPAYFNSDFGTEWLATVPNTGSWNWTIPYNRTYPSGYFIMIDNVLDYSIRDESDYYFSIVAPPSTGPSSVGLIGHWKFDGNGTNEISGGASAISVGNVSFNQSGGKFGGYVYILSKNDYLKIPYSSIFDLPNSFTIDFWFRQRSNQSFLQDLVYKGTPLNNYNFRVFRQLWNEYNFGPIITGYTAADTGYWTQTSNSNQLSHGSWHHVVYTKGTNAVAYYLDGNPIHNVNTATQAEYSGPTKTPAADIIIGDSAVDTDIDNLKIYNRALSSSEVLQSYTSSVASVRKSKSFSEQLADISAAFSRLLEDFKKLSP